MRHTLLQDCVPRTVPCSFFLKKVGIISYNILSFWTHAAVVLTTVSCRIFLTKVGIRYLSDSKYVLTYYTPSILYFSQSMYIKVNYSGFTLGSTPIHFNTCVLTYSTTCVVSKQGFNVCRPGLKRCYSRHRIKGVTVSRPTQSSFGDKCTGRKIRLTGTARGPRPGARGTPMSCRPYPSSTDTQAPLVREMSTRQDWVQHLAAQLQPRVCACRCGHGLDRNKCEKTVGRKRRRERDAGCIGKAVMGGRQSGTNLQKRWAGSGMADA